MFIGAGPLLLFMGLDFLDLLGFLLMFIGTGPLLLFMGLGILTYIEKILVSL
jgi:hypothetical protein